jgi:hypothetical protein
MSCATAPETQKTTSSSEQVKEPIISKLPAPPDAFASLPPDLKTGGITARELPPYSSMEPGVAEKFSADA